jgi:predicted RNase H-like HicB family nuclease
MAELIFEVTQETDGGYSAECLTLDIFAQGDTWHELRSNVREAVRAYFFAYLIDGPIPERVRLPLVRDEAFAPLACIR